MKKDYRQWLQREKYQAGTISTQLNRSGRVETHHGDLDEHYAKDRMEGLIQTLTYSTDDKRRNRPHPSSIPFDGDIRNNLASYRNAVGLYRRYRDSDEERTDLRDSLGMQPEIRAIVVEEAGQRIGLERDMQAALRIAIEQLEPGITIIDDGVERSVESGFIDITARDSSGATVVIELKAGAAGQRAVAQMLSYMGDSRCGRGGCQRSRDSRGLGF